jgi:hypothetical protein
MSDSEAQVTATEYVPDDDLRELLDEVLQEATVSYGDEQDLELSAGIEGMQRDYEVTFGEFEASGFETYTSLGVSVSLEGHLGLAASVILSQATFTGAPTQTYTDEAPPATLSDDPYQDLTAEWYHPKAVEIGFPESRLEQRTGGLDHDPIGLDELERYARVWLSAGEVGCT